jgi:alginate O-acetyltransferase complex protein AlgI
LTFGSLHFAIFFIAVVLLSFMLPSRARKTLLLLASLGFYASFSPHLLGLLAFIILWSYFSGIVLDKYSDFLRKIWLFIGIIIPLQSLIYFKYFDFLITQTNAFFHELKFNAHFDLLHLVLPAGISFYTFICVGYLIDVYRKKQNPEKNLLDFSLFVSWFPHILAGPIARAPQLLPQIKSQIVWNSERASSGLRLILWGLFKKAVIADQMSVFIAPVFSNPQYYQGPIILLAILGFTIQIYCDFSGYSDMAQGLSKILGWNLIDNFKRPYFSQSISEFWRRWHISLSTWFRDYVYIPLGGNRVGPLHQSTNLLITFALSGLWHGASWVYIIWGLWNGVLLVFEKFTSPIWSKTWARLPALVQHLKPVVNWILLFTSIVIGWIFFRSPSLAQAFDMMEKVTSGYSKIGHQIIRLNSHTGQEVWQLLILVIALIILVSAEMLQEFKGIYLEQKPQWLRWIIYWFLATSIIAFGKFGTAEFLYQQF